MNTISLFKGDSSGLLLIRPNLKEVTGVITDDWVCTTALVNVDRTDIVAPRTETTISDDGLHWVVGLSPDDTNSVDIDINSKYKKCYWVIQVSNESLDPAYSKEKHIQVNVKKQGII